VHASPAHHLLELSKAVNNPGLKAEAFRAQVKRLKQPQENRSTSAVSKITRSGLRLLRGVIPGVPVAPGAGRKAPVPLWVPPFRLFDLSEPVREFRFHPTKMWRIDFCWPDVRLAVEIEGGAFVYGRHNRPASFIKDMEKYNELTLAGYSLLRFTPQQLETGDAQGIIKAWFDSRTALSS